MKEYWEKLVSMLYPRRCPLCHEIVRQRGEKICRECKEELHPVREPKCKKCGKQLEEKEQEYCRDCRERKHVYQRGGAALPYTGKIKKSIYQMKYYNKREYLDFYGPYMAEILKKEILSWNAQVLVPVPLHKKRRRKRGFNQAELLADRVGEELGIPVEKNLVRRIRNTKPQKELIFRERQNNLKGAFKIRQYDVKLKKIILVDDIYTTGSTIDEIAGELLKRGVEEVYYIALCIGRDDG